VARREPRADTAATAVVLFAVTNVDYIIVLSVLFARRDLRFHSLAHRGEAVA
jgi:cadmium resistance protein CadD (predicted permease)